MLLCILVVFLLLFCACPMLVSNYAILAQDKLSTPSMETFKVSFNIDDLTI
jgi:hypothetical protein